MESPKILLCSAQPELISEWAQALSPIATLIECTQLGRLNDLVRIRKPDMIIFHIEGQLHRIDEAVGVVLEHEDTPSPGLGRHAKRRRRRGTPKGGRAWLCKRVFGRIPDAKRDSEHTRRRHLG